MSRFVGVNHVAMAARDLDLTLRFWRDLLGLRLVAVLGGPGTRQCFLEVSERDMLTFFEWPEVEPLPEKDHGYPVKGPFGFDHLSLGVASQDELWELKDRLEAAGFWVSEAVDHGFFHSVYSFDPNGLPIEFTWNCPARDVRREPALAGPGSSPAILDGPDPVPGRWPEPLKSTPPEGRVLYPGQGSELVDKER